MLKRSPLESVGASQINKIMAAPDSLSTSSTSELQVRSPAVSVVSDWQCKIEFRVKHICTPNCLYQKQKLDRDIFRWVTHDEYYRPRQQNENPQSLGYFRIPDEAKYCDENAAFARGQEYEFFGPEGCGASTFTGHAFGGGEVMALHDLSDIKAALGAKGAVFSVDMEALEKLEQKDVIGGLKDGAPGWFSTQNIYTDKRPTIRFCYKLPRGTELPNDLYICYDGGTRGHQTGHATIGIRKTTTLKTGVGPQGQKYGIHLALVKMWKLHCFLFAARADVHEETYPDPDALTLLMRVDMFMDNCDLAVFQRLRAAFEELEKLDPISRTLTAVFKDSKHGSFLVDIVRQSLEISTAEDMDRVERILQKLGVS
jgi:hypothetical protein